MWSPKTGWGQAKDVLEAHDLKPITLAPKEVQYLYDDITILYGIGQVFKSLLWWYLYLRYRIKIMKTSSCVYSQSVSNTY